jgi:hypothetical protein
MKIDLKRLSPKRMGWKGRVSSLGVVILLGFVLYLIHHANTPASGTVAVNTKAGESAITDSTDYSTINNEFFSLLYPSDLNPDFPAQQPTGTLAYNFFAKRDAKQNITDSLEVYARLLPAGGVTLDSDYHAYLSQPEIYKLSQKFVRGEVVDVATKNKELLERNALWVHGRYLLILKLKGSDKSTLDTQFNTILKSTQVLKT